MAHQRQLIRTAVKDALIAAATSAGANVQATRMVAWGRNDLPAIAVYTLEETSDDQQSAPRELQRVMQLAIEAAVKPAGNVDDALDAICLEIERAMHADAFFGGVCAGSSLTSTELDVLESGDKTIGLARLVYTVAYQTQAPDAVDQTFDDLSTAATQYSLAGAQATADRAKDTLEDLET